MTAHHNHGGSSHSHGASSQRAIGIAALLTGSFMVVEVVGGIVSGSLALLADAGHMLTDFAALSLAWFAFRLSRRPADWQRTYGFDRFSVLAAFINGLALIVITGWICVEAFYRLGDPVPVLGGVMFWIAAGGLVVNILAFWVVSGGENKNLNVRAAALHIAGDLLGSAGALTAALVIILTGWTLIDPILSIGVAVIILRSAWCVLSESGHILLEGVPGGFDGRKVAEAIARTVPGIVRVHHIHAWSITEERPMATLEVLVSSDVDHDATKHVIKSLMSDEFGIGHTTVEISNGTRPQSLGSGRT